MVPKKIFAFVFSIIILLSLTACRSNNNNTPADNSDNNYFEGNSINNTTTDLQISTPVASDGNPETTTISDVTTKNTTSSVTTTHAFDDPTLWTKSKIIDVYKKAAEQSNSSVISAQAITLKDISVNNGAFSGVFQLVKPIISQVLANNSTESDGITGGYMNLVETDVYGAKAYADGENTAIEMVMYEQTDGARGDVLSGTVGHAISVVGDISVVTDQLKDLGLPIEISDDNTSIIYTNPSVKVLIDSDGKIINGTWSYTVEISLNNYNIGNTKVDNTSVVLENVITVNGGFSK